MKVANIQQRRTSAGNGNGGKLSPQSAIRKICMHPNKSSRGHRVALALLQKEHKEKAVKSSPLVLEHEVVAGSDRFCPTTTDSSVDAGKVRQETGSTPAERDIGDVYRSGIIVWEDNDFQSELEIYSSPQQKKSSTEAGTFSGLRLHPTPLLPVRCSTAEEVASPAPETAVQGSSTGFDDQPKEWRRSSLEASPEQESLPQEPRWLSAVEAPHHPLGLEPVVSEEHDRYADLRFPWSQDEGTLSSESSPKRSARGLRNLGNTCYINSVLQMLHSLESFKSDLEAACSKVSAPSTENSVLFTLQAVLKQLDCNASRAPVNPIRLKKVFASYQERFLDYSQEDAHEFLVYLLDQVQDEIRPALEPAVQAEGKTISCENQQTCPIKENFGCTVKTTLECTNCSRSSHVDEPFLHFTLGMPQSSGHSEGSLLSSSEAPADNQDLRSLLDLTFKETTVEYKCEKCEGTTSKSCARFSSLPRLLILHLKRLHLGCKSSAPIKFTEQLDMSKWCCTKTEPHVEDTMDTTCAEERAAEAGPPFLTNYHLHAMISHLGGSGECGHFITDAFDRNTNTWLRCDDDYVTQVSPEHIFNATKEMEGYIFVYIRDPP